MNRSLQICVPMLAGVIVTFALLAICLPAFFEESTRSAPLLLVIFPFFFLLREFEIIAPGFAFFLVLVQYPAYGFFLGMTQVSRKPIYVICAAAVHLAAVIFAAVLWRNH